MRLSLKRAMLVCASAMLVYATAGCQSSRRHALADAPCSAKSVAELADYERQTVSWLQGFRWEGRRVPAGSKPQTFEQWVSAGKEIPYVIPILNALLADKGSGVWRDQVAGVLGLIGDESSIVVLYDALLDASGDVRSCAVGSLGDLKASVSIGRICELALCDPEANVRANAFVALHAIGDPRAAQTIREGAKDRNDMVRDAAKGSAR